MEKSHFLTKEDSRALYTLRRRRRELKRRIENANGSENSLSWDKAEHKALTVVMKLVEDNFSKEEKNQDYVF